MSTWQLYLDDLRHPDQTYTDEVRELRPREWTVARSSAEAIKLVQEHGMPVRLSLDHDLGICDNGKGGVTTDVVMTFLKWLANEYWDGVQDVPWYAIHSANPVGAKNIQSFMDSWVRSVEMKA
jgi:hypothetical protein